MIEFESYEDLEFRDAEEIRSTQNSLLRQHACYCAENSPYYRELFQRNDVDPNRITVDNLTEVPLTSKDALGRRNGDFMAVRMEEIVDVVFSSGTTGNPTQVAYTENDLERLAHNEFQSFRAAGITKSDRVLLTCTMDRCFVAGLAYFLGTRRLGAAAIRNGHGTMETHTETIRRVEPTVAIGVPSFLRKLGRHMDGAGEPPAQSSVDRLLCIGEPLRDEEMKLLPVGQQLEELWDASLHSTYASTETVSTFCECTAQNGGHLHPELAVVELVNENGIRVSPGEQGEVVLTPLGTEGMPLVRFRTGDISFMIDEPCECGRRSVRLGPILARRQQMIKLKGTTIYPRSIERALSGIGEVEEYYLEVTSDGDLSDRVSVHVAVEDGGCTEEYVAENLRTRLRVRPRVVIEPLEEIQKQVFSPEYRKPMRFLDRRQG
ncbi:MAG: phenylacetate--CoA ligase family protein [Planctomycetota bacterium]